VPSVDDLAARVPRLPGLLVEHIVSPRENDGDWTGAVLVDQWGRRHPLRATSTIGRERDVATIAILENSVSRLHAELRHEPGSGADGRWLIKDLSSTNGTFVEHVRITDDREVRDQQLLVIGNVGFVFVRDGTTITSRRVTAPASTVEVSVARTAGHPAGTLRMIEPAAGEGGVVELGGQSVQLGVTQYALVVLLAERYLKDGARDATVRGFVRAIDLITELPWDTAHPGDNNVKQLVRRVRRSLEKLGLEEAIESRHGFGYRLVLPGV
jgi:pSer/pThr/pTyr-binding forkhead associated (FHA) protein